MPTKFDLRAPQASQVASRGELVQRLAQRVDSLGCVCARMKRRENTERQARFDMAIEDARSALAAGEPQALEAALRSLDFLSFELCEE